MKATGVVRRIDDLGRIVIPKEIRRTLRIRDGESLEIFVDQEAITLRKFSSSVDLTTISQALLDTVYNILKKNVFVTDRDVFIAGSGELKKDFLGKTLSSTLEDLLVNHEKTTRNNVPLKEMIVTQEICEDRYSYILYPILVNGETIGLVLMVKNYKEQTFDEEDEQVIQIISQFLGKYLED